MKYKLSWEYALKGTVSRGLTPLFFTLPTNPQVKIPPGNLHSTVKKNQKWPEGYPLQWISTIVEVYLNKCQWKAGRCHPSTLLLSQLLQVLYTVCTADIFHKKNKYVFSFLIIIFMGQITCSPLHKYLTTYLKCCYEISSEINKNCPTLA